MACPQCFTGHKNPGTPTGRVETVHGLPTYVAEPAKGKPTKGIVVVVPDAFGWEFVNNRILADHYANGGDYKVFLPEFMNGNACPQYVIRTMSNMAWYPNWIKKAYYGVLTMWSFIPFLIRNRTSVSYPRVRSFLEAIRTNEGAKLPVGVAGFCWGGLHTFKLAQNEKASNGKPLLDAGFTAHPSSLTIPQDAEKITKPIAVAIGDQDFVLPMNQVDQMKQTWAKMQDNVDTEIRVYPGAGHGFSIRADPNSKDETKQSVEAEEQAISWFQKQFSKVSY